MGDTGKDSAELVSYSDFGRQFFEHGVTEARVRATVGLLTGQPIEFGPTGVGPGRLVRLTARGAIGELDCVPAYEGELVAYRVTLPVSLRFEVDLGLETHKFDARLSVPLLLTARAVDGLKVLIDITPPSPRDIATEVQAKGMRASLLQRVVGVEGEVKRFVATYVAREVDKPHVRRARMIDVGGAIDAAWSAFAPKGPSPTVAYLLDDLDAAIAVEIEESSQRPADDEATR